MNEFFITLLDGQADNAPKPVKTTWTELVKTLSVPRVGPKNGPAWVPAVFSPGEPRRRDTVEALSVAVLDLDESAQGQSITRADFEAVCERIEAAGVRACVHTTHSATREQPKARVVFQVDRWIEPGEWPAVRASLCKRFEIYADPGAKDVSRLFFLPAVSAEGAYFFGASTDADKVLSVSELLGSAPSNAPATTRLEVPPATPPPASGDQPVNMVNLRWLLNSSRGQHSDLIRKALAGVAVADKGSRDTTLNALAAATRFAVPSDTPTAALLELYRSSVQMIPAEQGEDWIEVLREKLDRHQQRRRDYDKRKAAEREDLLKSLRKESGQLAPVVAVPEDVAPEEVDTSPYSAVEIAEFAAAQNCDTQDFRKRWIVSNANSFYVFVNGRYLQPITRNDLPVSLLRDLSRAPVELQRQSKRGDFLQRPVGEILAEHSTVARATVASLSLQRSFYDPRTQTFHEAVTPLRPITPRYHDEIHQWLLMLDPHRLKVVEWVAALPKLDYQCCALYISGASGSGKTLFASGFARLWSTGGFSAFKDIVNNFNDPLLRCPLVCADESMPDKKDITSELRRLIGSRERALNRKFMPSATLHGSIRLILLANNERMLHTEEQMTADDIEAVGGRILFRRVTKEATEYLKKIGRNRLEKEWILGDMMAEHSLYLSNSRPATDSNDRYLVDGDSEDFHSALALNSGLALLITQWLVLYFSDPNAPPIQGVEIGSGWVMAHAEAMAKQVMWDRYVPSTRVESAAKISQTLKAMAHKEIEHSVNRHQPNEFRKRVMLIGGKRLIDWAREHGIGNPERLRELLAKKSDRMPLNVVDESEKYQ